MRRQQFLTAVLLLVSTSCVTLAAQSGFPNPAYVLSDTTNKNKKNGVKVDGNQITIVSGVGTPTAINAIAFSADGSLIAAAKDGGRVVVWRTDKHDVLRAFDTTQGIVQAVGISPDATVIATAGLQEDGMLKLWSLQTGKLLSKFPITHGRIQYLKFVSNESMLVNENGPVYILDLKSGKHLFDQPSGEGLTILSRDGKELVSAKGDEFLIRSLPDGSIRQHIIRPDKNAWPLAYSRSDRLLIFGMFASKPGFHALHVSEDGATSISDTKTLPQFNPSAGYFVDIDEQNHIVWLHSDARIWAWDPVSNKACASSVMYSESGEISVSANLAVSGGDNGIFNKSQLPVGIAVWKMDDVLRECKLR